MTGYKQEPQYGGYSGAFSPDETTFFTVSTRDAMANGTRVPDGVGALVQAWDVKTWGEICSAGAPVVAVSGPDSVLPKIAVGPDSRTIAVTSIHGIFVLQLQK